MISVYMGELITFLDRRWHWPVTIGSLMCSVYANG